jgi:hypothetical protein
VSGRRQLDRQCTSPELGELWIEAARRLGARLY